MTRRIGPVHFLKRPYAPHAAMALIAIAFSVAVMWIYLAGEIRGLLSWHVLPAAVFGIPHSVAKHGMTLLYETPGHVGWDGQFYYYIANDLKLGPGTIAHIDAPTYRYQRIGLALAAKLVSLITFQNWVSPLVYWGTNVLLVAAGSWALVGILKRLALPAWFALFWCLSAGVQVTVLNGLPDAAADAFFLMALACFVANRTVAYVALVTMAILSREAYAVAAGGLFLIEGLRLWREKHAPVAPRLGRLIVVALPGIALVAWQLYIYRRFGKFPSQEPGVAGSLVNLPFAGWWQTMSGSFTGKHLFFGANVPWTERWFEPIHGVLLIAAILCSIALLRLRDASRTQRAIAAAILPFALLSTTLGPVVTGHWSGYIKATTTMILPIMALIVARPAPVRFAVAALLAAFVGAQQGAMADRILPDAPASAGQFSSVESVLNKPSGSFPQTLACLGEYRSNLILRSVSNFDRRPIFRLLLNRPMRYRLDVDVTNTTDRPWQHAQGSGSVSLVGRWVVHGTSQEIGQSRRAIIGEDLKPGETRRLSLVVDLPPYADTSDLVLTMIQDGCAWFADAGDQGAIRLRLK